jgi:hypothetical protein
MTSAFREPLMRTTL